MKKLMFGMAAAAAALAAPAGAQTLINQTTGPNGHTYRLYYQPLKLTWAEAEAAAVAQGGHLASVADLAENALLYSLVSGLTGTVTADMLYLNDGNRTGPFLGGFRTVPGGAFSWSDGSTFGFTNWAPGEPSNFGGAENFLQFFALGSDPVDEPNEGSFCNDVGPNPATDGRMLSYFVELDAPAAVPEPAGWAMMILGFGALGALLRRRPAGRAALA